MKPEEVGYLTELDWIYSNELKEVGDSDSFAKFLAKWDYWLDASTRELKGSDWSWLSSLIADCRKKGRIIAKRYREVLLVVHVKEKHEPAMELLMPEKRTLIIKSLLTSLCQREGCSPSLVKRGVGRFCDNDVFL